MTPQMQSKKKLGDHLIDHKLKLYRSSEISSSSGAHFLNSATGFCPIDACCEHDFLISGLKSDNVPGKFACVDGL
jgi:hypothetical protein